MLGALEGTGLLRRLIAAQTGKQAVARLFRTQPCRAASNRTVERNKPSNDTSKAQKEKMLEAAMEGINGRFGAGSIMKLGSKPLKVESVPTGALTLDVALGGGFPKGRIVEIFGPESSGKTTLALHAIASVQRSGGTACLIDAEHAFDPIYSKNMGVDVEHLVMCQPDSGEMALEAVDQLIRSCSVDIIVVDSVAALTPKAELEGEIGAVQLGAQARLMSQALRKLSSTAAKCNILVIFLNQLRMKIGVIYGNPEVTTGGNALKFYSSVRVDVRRIKTLEEAKEQVGIKVRAKVVKNKCAPPFKICEFDIMFGSGISTLGCLLDAAEKVGVVVRKGGWYSYEDRNVGQGRERVIQSLSENPELAEDIEAKTRERLASADINDIISTDTAPSEGADTLLEGEEEVQEELREVVA